MTKYISKIKVGNAEYPIKDTTAATRIEELQQSVNNVTTTPGPKGDDGVTPHIDSTTGNWFIGDTDTGVKAQGTNGTNGTNGVDGTNGINGKSAYELWLDEGNSGTMTDFLSSLKGEQGPQGEKGEDGEQGIQGERGNDGNDGKSAYQIAIDNGFVGTEQEWLESLKGADGSDGTAADVSGKIDNGGGVAKEVALTKAEYNALATKEQETLYIITDDVPSEKAYAYKVCPINNITNLTDLVQQYSLIENNLVVLTNIDDSKTYSYSLNNETKTFKGDSEHDLLFRYCGNNEFKPVMFGIL